MGKSLIYNDKFEKKKPHFFQKKALKSTFSIFWLKKALMMKETHKKAHVLFKSTPYKACSLIRQKVH